MLPLQQLHDGRLRGGHDDHAAVLAAAHQAPVGRDVNAGCHPQRLVRVGDDAQLVDDAGGTRAELVEGFLKGYGRGALKAWRKEGKREAALQGSPIKPNFMTLSSKRKKKITKIWYLLHPPAGQGWRVCSKCKVSPRSLLGLRAWRKTLSGYRRSESLEDILGAV